MLFEARQTGIIIPVPEAEPIVAALRAEHDPSAPRGVPAHVTLLYPYLAEPLVTDAVLADLAALVAARPAFEVTFAGPVRFPDTLYLAPEPATPFAELTAAIAARWPEAPPYGGQFTEVIPHLTVAHQPDEVDEALFDRITRAVSPGLPITALVREAWLYTYDGEAWHPHTRLPLS